MKPRKKKMWIQKKDLEHRYLVNGEDIFQLNSSIKSQQNIQTRWSKKREGSRRGISQKSNETNRIFYIFRRTDKSQRISSYCGIGTQNTVQKKTTQLLNLVKTKLVQATKCNHNAPHD